MIRSVTQPDSTAMPHRFRERLAALGVGVVRLGADGRVHAETDLSWIERLIAGSPTFAAGVRALWAEIGENSGTVIEIWPGVSLAPMPVSGRRRLDNMRCPLEIVTALILSPSLVSSDQLRRVCDQAGMDFRATVAKIDPNRLVDNANANRLALLLAWLHEDAGEIDHHDGELQAMSRELADSYEELSLLYQFSTSMTVNREPGPFLTEACAELQQVVGLRWLGMRLTGEEPRLGDLGLAGEQYIAGNIGCDAPTLREIGDGLMDQFVRADQPVILDDTTAVDIPGLARVAGSLLVVPLRREGEPLGIIFGGDKIDSTHISSVDSKLCDSLANSLSIFLDNLMLYEDAQAMFMGTLHALTRAIDAKDSYTHGHSERVALMSRMLAEAAGLDAYTVDRVYIAGLVHDVGKIGVPEAVLTKPGKLTDAEFDMIKRHPEIGAQIVKDIHPMQDLIPGVMYHHERWDGRGYPHGLTGEDIPLFGRLICLADSFDAMSSNRTYRSRLDREAVIREVRDCRGTQFDPELADVFVTIDFEPFDQMIRRHQSEKETWAA